MNAAQPAVWLYIPRDSHLLARINADSDIHVMVGRPGDDLNMIFDRSALSRLVEIAGHLLAVPGNTTGPDITLGDDSAFITGLRHLEEQLGPYVDWLRHLDESGAEPFPFEDQMMLSVIMSSLGESVRDLAYSRREPDTAPANGTGHAKERPARATPRPRPR